MRSYEIKGALSPSALSKPNLGENRDRNGGVVVPLALESSCVVSGKNVFVNVAQGICLIGLDGFDCGIEITECGIGDRDRHQAGKDWWPQFHQAARATRDRVADQGLRMVAEQGDLAFEVRIEVLD